mmetsp:Transcript_56421/g.175010  ORF Transcript_56421/g.175010 Transcript_56421/m.175010 type:complete len:389 (+) Transcript_56421:163-1329(+)
MGHACPAAPALLAEAQDRSIRSPSLVRNGLPLLGPLAGRRVFILARLVGDLDAVAGLSDGVARHGRGAINEARAEEDIRVVEHALLEGHHDELRVGEMRPDHVADVLCMAQVQGRVDLVKDVHRRRLEEQEREHQGEGQQGALAAGELRQRALPDAVEGNLDLQALCGVHALGRLQLGVGVGQEGAEDRVEVLVHLDPRTTQGLGLLLVQVADDVLDLALVVEDDVALLEQVLVLLLRLLEHGHCLFVDVLAEGLLLCGQVVQPCLVLLVVVCLKVKVSASLAEKGLLLLDPRMLLLHPGHHDVRLLVILLQLLELVAEPLLLQLLLLPLLPVCGELRGELAQGLVEALEAAAQGLQLLAQLGVKGALLLQGGLQLLHLRRQALVALP